MSPARSESRSHVSTYVPMKVDSKTHTYIFKWNRNDYNLFCQPPRLTNLETPNYGITFDLVDSFHSSVNASSVAQFSMMNLVVLITLLSSLTACAFTPFHTVRSVAIQRIGITQCPRKPAFMSVEGDFDPDAISKAKEEIQAGSIKARLRAIYKFTRPHTIRGTMLGSIAGTIRALIDTPGSIASANWGIMLPRAFIGLISLLLGNAFIVGINQIYDDEIDKLNKPFLPVASGEMSKRFAWLVVLLSGAVGPALV